MASIGNKDKSSASAKLDALLRKQKLDSMLNKQKGRNYTSVDLSYYTSTEYSNNLMHQIDASHIPPSDPYQQEAWQNFDRYYSVNMNLDHVDTRYQYVFMVRPECNIVKETNKLELCDSTAKDPFFIWMNAWHSVILRGLTMEFDASHDFIPFLVGRTEMLQLPDYAIKSYQYYQPYTHYSLPYGGTGIESQSGGTFDMSFKDDHQFRLHKFFQAWLYYIDGVSRNRFHPKEKFITYNKIDYATSVYHFIMAPDGKHIQWWSKYTGCVPTSISNSDLSWNKGGTFDGKFSVPFQYFYFESLNPEILGDFNRNSNGARTLANGYNNDFMSMGNHYVGAPYVSVEGGGYSFVLNWREPKTDFSK